MQLRVEQQLLVADAELKSLAPPNFNATAARIRRLREHMYASSKDPDTSGNATRAKPQQPGPRSLLRDERFIVWLLSAQALAAQRRARQIIYRRALDGDVKAAYTVMKWHGDI
jgi:hypothetical protein